MTLREKAFRLVSTMRDRDLARELGMTVMFVRNEIRSGRLVAAEDGQIRGSAFSDYLIQRGHLAD
jgi:hypothetical protein